jgi:excinuclease UvrABC ATPase subunit
MSTRSTGCRLPFPSSRRPPQPQPALDRRHGHRDLRLHAPAVRARRRSLFAGHRPADREPDRQPDGRPGDGAGGRHAALPAGADRARPQGRVPQGIRRADEEGLPAGQGRRRVYEIADVPPLDKKYKHDIDVVVDRIVVRPDIATGWPTASRPRSAGRRAGIAEFADKPLPNPPKQPARQQIAQRTHERMSFRRNSPARSPASPFRDRAAAVFLQQPVRRLPHLRRARHPAEASTPALSCRTSLSLRDGAIAPWAKTVNTSPYYTQTLEALGKHYGFKMTDAVERPAEKVQDAILYGTGDEAITFVYDDGCAPTRRRRPSRA